MHLLLGRNLNYRAAVLQQLRADLPIYTALVVYLALGEIYVTSRSADLFDGITQYLQGAVVLYCLVMPAILLAMACARAVRSPHERPGMALLRMLSIRTVGRFLAGTLLMLLVLVPFGAMFSSVKSALSLGGFAFDRQVADIDSFLHFGRAPSTWLLQLSSSPVLQQIVAVNYDMGWSLLCFGFFYWVTVSPRADTMRVRYCLTFMLVWIIVGNVLAGIFTTAGPAYYGRATGDLLRFAELQRFLHPPGFFAATRKIQDYLWALHRVHRSGFAAGISAFPSMHVSMVAFTALFIAERSRIAGVFAWLFVAAIMASSVYLGWHYAVDGYAAVLLTTAIYFAVKYLRQMRLPAFTWRYRPLFPDATRDAAAPEVEPVTPR